LGPKSSFPANIQAEVENKTKANSFESLFKSRIVEQKKLNQKKIDSRVEDKPMASKRLSEIVVTEKRIIIDADFSLPKQAIEQAPEATVAVQGEFPVERNQALVELYPVREEGCLAQARLPVGLPAITAPGISGPSQCFSENEKTPMEPRTETNQPGDTYTCHLRPASSAQEKLKLSKDVILSKEPTTSTFILAAVETPPDPILYSAEVSSIVKPAAETVHLPASKRRSIHPFLSDMTIPSAEYKKFIERRNYTRRRWSTTLTSYQLSMEEKE